MSRLRSANAESRSGATIIEWSLPLAVFIAMWAPLWHQAIGQL